MLVIGSMNLKSTKGTGEFICPRCRSPQPYRHRASRPFLTLYFIPVLPIGGLTEFLVCGKCKAEFPVSVLEQQAKLGTNENVLQSMFDDDLKTAMVLAMLVDQRSSEQEIDAAIKVFGRFTEKIWKPEEVLTQCVTVGQLRLSPTGFISQRAPVWSGLQRKQIVQAVFYVASTNGELTSIQLNWLKQSLGLLRFSEDEYRSIIEETFSW